MFTAASFTSAIAAAESGSWLLPLLLLVPLLGGLSLAWLPPRRALIQTWALIYTLLTLAIAGIVAATFDFGDPAAFQLAGVIPWVEAFGLSFRFGIDSISLWLLLLTAFLMPLVVLGSFSAVEARFKEFYLWLLVLEAAMLGVFLATDVIFFYVCFEFTLIPLYFLIGIFGSAQRLKAARVFFLYTFTGSMLTLAAILYVAWFHAAQTGEWSFVIRDLYAAAQNLPEAAQQWVFLGLLVGFAVKVPLFPVHTWLPLAHTEAPTAGSVVLAGVLLKLGTYGLVRFALPMAPEAVIAYAPLVGVLAVIGILYTALICWVQRDIKKLIAYSSVSHLGFCVLGMFAIADVIGPSGSVMYMVNHGLSTGALFLCVGMIYERFHTREMRHFGGLGRAMPVWSFFMVFFVLASVGLPGLNGFVGEFLTLLGAFVSGETLGPSFAIAAGLGMIFAAIYLLTMVGKAVFGPLHVPEECEREAHAGTLDLNKREVVTLAPLAVACLVLGLYPSPVLKSLEPPLERIVAPAQEVAEAEAGPGSQTHAAVETEGAKAR